MKMVCSVARLLEQVCKEERLLELMSIAKRPDRARRLCRTQREEWLVLPSEILT